MYFGQHIEHVMTWHVQYWWWCPSLGLNIAMWPKTVLHLRLCMLKQDQQPIFCKWPNTFKTNCDHVEHNTIDCSHIIHSLVIRLVQESLLKRKKNGNMIVRVGLNKLAEQLSITTCPNSLSDAYELYCKMVLTAAKKSISCTICKVYVMTRNVKIYIESTQEQRAPKAGTQQQTSSSAEYTTITSKDWQGRSTQLTPHTPIVRCDKSWPYWLDVNTHS